MRMRGVDARSVRTERVVHGARKRLGLVRREVDVRGVEQHEIVDVGAQMDRVGAQPDSASFGRLVIDESRDGGHRPVGARGRRRVAERAEGERFERVLRGRVRGVPGPGEEPVEPVELESRHERLRRLRITRARGRGAEQPRHQQDELGRRSAPHGASTRFREASAQRVARRRRQHQWMPVFAQVTARTPAIDVSGAPPHGCRENRWIPAFAGMTAGGAPAYGARNIMPAGAGMTAGGAPAYAVRNIMPAFAGMTAGGAPADAVRNIMPAGAGMT